VAVAHALQHLVLGQDGAGILDQRDVGEALQAGERGRADRVRDKDFRSHHCIHLTTPATPSTATWLPSGIRPVASSTPSTIGMPRSRAREAMCEVEPPSSATTPATRGRMWLSAGPATLVTSTSPGATRAN